MYGDARRARALMPSQFSNDFHRCNSLDVHPVNLNLTPGYRTYADYDIGDISVVRRDLNGREIKND